MAIELAHAVARLAELAELVDGEPRRALAEADRLASRFPAGDIVQVRRGIVATAAHRAMGDHASALSEADATVARADSAQDDEGAGLIRLSRAAVRVRIGDVEGGDDDLDQARALLTGSHVVDVEVQRASVDLQLGRLEQAARGLLATIELGRTHHRPREVARAHSNLGLLYVHQGRYDAAEAELHSAIAIFTELSLTDGRLYAEHNLGYLRFCQGHLPDALGHFENAENAADTTGVFLPALEIDRAEALAAAGLFSAAERVARAAARRLEGRGLEGRGSEGRGNDEASLPAELGDALVIEAAAAGQRGDWQQAHTTAERAVAIARALDRPKWQAVAELIELDARRHISAIDPADALARLDWIISVLEETHAAHYLSEALLLGVDAAGLAGDRPLAESYLQRLDRLARSEGPRLRARRHLARAVLDERSGRHRSAKRAASAAIEAARSTAATTAAIELRFSNRRLISDAASVGFRLSVRSDARMRWNDRRERMAGGLPPIVPAADPTLRELAAASRNAEVELRQALQSDRDPAEIADAARTAASAERRVAAHVRSQRTRPTTTTPSPPPVETAHPKHDVLSFGVHGGELWGFVRCGGRHRDRVIGPADEVRDLVHRLGRRARLAVVAGRDIPGGREAARLDEMLAPLVSGIGRERPVAVVPGRALAGLVPGLLPCLADAVLVRSPSAEHGVSTSVLPPTPSVQSIAGPGLDHAQSEVTAIAGIHGIGGVSADDASASRVIDELASRDLVHLAMHLRLRDDNPMFGELVCADGPLMMHELQGVESLPTAIVLATCEAARTVADEAPSLAEALLSLGVPTVIGSELEVGDAASAAVMPTLHSALRRGFSAAEALRDLRVAGGWVGLAAACFDVCGADLRLDTSA